MKCSKTFHKIFISWEDTTINITSGILLVHANFWKTLQVTIRYYSRGMAGYRDTFSMIFRFQQMYETDATKGLLNTYQHDILDILYNILKTCLNPPEPFLTFLKPVEILEPSFSFFTFSLFNHLELYWKQFYLIEHSGTFLKILKSMWTLLNLLKF